MLRFIKIRNLALIRELKIEFGPGLNILTGETGSGKSILVDALGLLLGARSSQDTIRSGCNMAVLEGIFDSDAYATHELIEAGFPVEDDSILIRREVSLSGRNRIFINNELATLSLLRSIGSRLADIHGQQDQRALLDLAMHSEWLDRFGGNARLLDEVRECYRSLQTIARRLESTEMHEQERLRRLDILQFQLNEIRSVNPQVHEFELLLGEKALLSNHEKILSHVTEAYSLLYESDSSILSQMGRLGRILQELESFDVGWSPHKEAVRDSSYRLEEVAFSARDYAARNDFSPERLEEIHQRLYMLEKLTKRYGSSIEDVLRYAAECDRELEDLLACVDASCRLGEQFREEERKYLESSRKLSRKRRQDAECLEREIRREFSALAMERMKLNVRFYPNAEEAGTGLMPSYYGLNGTDHVEFLIAPNTGEEMKPLARIASGGELSRLVLAIKSLCGSEEGKTLVFDEVDAGIGGRVAEAVGKRLRELSRNKQVLCVTHLPHIAAFARKHISVRKEIVAGRTETFIGSLNQKERIQELARMLGGEIITEATRRHAREMLEQSMETGVETQE